MLPRTILSSANRGHRRKKRHAFKDSLLGRPKQKGLTQWASHGSMVGEQFQEKLSPPHWMPTIDDLTVLMRKWLLNSITLVAATHSKLKKTVDGASTQIATCMINKWRAKINENKVYNVRDSPVTRGKKEGRLKEDGCCFYHPGKLLQRSTEEPRRRISPRIKLEDKLPVFPLCVWLFHLLTIMPGCCNPH